MDIHCQYSTDSPEWTAVLAVDFCLAEFCGLLSLCSAAFTISRIHQSLQSLFFILLCLLRPVLQPGQDMVRSITSRINWDEKSVALSNHPGTINKRLFSC